MPTHKNDLRFSAFKMDVDKKWKKEIFLSQYKYFVNVSGRTESTDRHSEAAFSK